jgi:hypothetical protein
MKTRHPLAVAALGWFFGTACGDVHADLITGHSAAAPTGCASDADCAEPQKRCDTASRSCVQCLGVGFVGDCPSGTACAQPAGKCVTACKDAEACSSRVCDGNTGLCRACSNDDDCPISHHRCDASGRCAECVTEGEGDCPDPDHPFCANGTCVECTRNGDCDGEEQCSAELGECAVPCEDGGACSSDDPVCHPELHFCVQCVDDSDCGGRPCRKWECVR